MSDATGWVGASMVVKSIVSMGLFVNFCVRLAIQLQWVFLTWQVFTRIITIAPYKKALLPWSSGTELYRVHSALATSLTTFATVSERFSVRSPVRFALCVVFLYLTYLTRRETLLGQVWYLSTVVLIPAVTQRNEGARQFTMEYGAGKVRLYGVRL
jgi:hypothetical protein